MATPNINYAPLTPVSNETNARTDRVTRFLQTPVATSGVETDVPRIVKELQETVADLQQQVAKLLAAADLNPKI
jgi:hypothetical protein